MKNEIRSLTKAVIYLFATWILILACGIAHSQTVSDIHHYKDPVTLSETNWRIEGDRIFLWGSGEYRCLYDAGPDCGVMRHNSFSVKAPLDFPAVNIVWDTLICEMKSVNPPNQQTSMCGLQTSLPDGTIISGISVREDVQHVSGFHLPSYGFPIIWFANNWNYNQVMGFYVEGRIVR